MKEKPFLVICEGSQGSGKTTVTNYLREHIPSTNLYRLSGTKAESTNMSFEYHNEVLNSIQRMGELGVDNNIVFDRSFLTEWCYRKLGYKGKNREAFDTYGIALSGLLESLTELYNIVVVSLVLDCVNDYEHRLKRDKATYECAPFNAKRSMAQQDTYLELIKELKHRAPSVKVLPINTNHTSLVEIKYLVTRGGK